MRQDTSSPNYHRQDLGDILSEILRAADWRRVHQAGRAFEAHRTRWKLGALIRVALFMALSHTRTLKERFAESRATVQALRSHRRGGGETAEGYLAALAQLPPGVVAVLRERMQAYVKRRGLEPARVGRFLAYGFDGTKQNMPLTEANLAHFGSVTKKPRRPQRVVLAAVALGRCQLWDWECGLADASERELAERVGRRLPAGALEVCDAGFVGYEHLRGTVAAGRHVLVRVGAHCRFLVRRGYHFERQGEEVWLWPKDRRGEAPLRLRLLRVCRKRRRRVGKQRRRLVRYEELWLATDLLDPAALTLEEARDLYKLRWPGNEVGFRQWKHVLVAENLLGRTPGEVEREADFSLLALMALQATVQVTRAQRGWEEKTASVAEARRVWLAAGRATLAAQSSVWCGRKLAACVLDEYVRQGPKAKRRWAARKPHRPLGRPRFRRMPKSLYVKGCKHLQGVVT